MNLQGALLVHKLFGGGYMFPKYLWKSISASLGSEASPWNACSMLHNKHKKKVSLISLCTIPAVSFNVSYVSALHKA